MHWRLVRRILSTISCSHTAFLCIQVVAVPKSCHGSASFSTELFRIKTPYLETFSLFPILFGERTQLHFIHESDLFLSFRSLLPPAFLADFAFTLIFFIPPHTHTHSVSLSVISFRSRFVSLMGILFRDYFHPTQSI